MQAQKLLSAVTFFFTGNRSLLLETQDSKAAGGGSWTQKYTGPMPAPGSTLELYAFVKGENLRDLSAGGRISIFFQVLSRSGGLGVSARAEDTEYLQGDLTGFC